MSDRTIGKMQWEPICSSALKTHCHEISLGILLLNYLINLCFDHVSLTLTCNNKWRFYDWRTKEVHASSHIIGSAKVMYLESLLK